MLISLENITIDVDGRRYFDHTTWLIRRGENWAITGATGAGKSLLARAICQQIRLVDGQIRYYFDDDHPEESRSYFYPGEIQTLSSETHQDFLRRYSDYHQARWQSQEADEVPCVRDVLDSCVKDPTQTGEIERVMDLLQIEHLLERKILHLSNGESRKVLIARALVQNPKLLILEDPLTGLDRESRVAFSNVFAVLAKQVRPQMLMIMTRDDEIPAEIDHRLTVQNGRIIGGTGFQNAEGHPIQTGPDGDGKEPSLPGDGGRNQRETAKAAFERMAGAYSEAFQAHAEGFHDPVVGMEGVSIQYGGSQILRDIHWTVRTGERWALLGPNGAGKTTLLSLILADNPQAYANDIVLFGRPRGMGESIWEIKAKIGWVSPELQIHYPRTATCAEVVESGFFDSVGLYRRCTPAQKEVSAGWMEAFGLSEFTEKRFDQLSAGRQRLALLARALVKFPPLLILDEPCQGLDQAHREIFVDLLEHLCRRTGLTMIYVTHYPDEVPATITHRLSLDAGKGSIR
jgi:molybdate transport system ATP-binding protein